MKSKVYQYFKQGFEANTFIRVGTDRLRLYVGKDANSRYSFEFRGTFIPTRINSSEVIDVKQTKIEDLIILRISLLKQELIEYFSLFCEDLVDAVKDFNEDKVAYLEIRARYLAWKKLFKPDSNKLSEAEIMGLIGELLFLKNYMFIKWGSDAALNAWTGPDDLHKDFSIDELWYEIKAINVGKETVKISSIEQLDSDTDGFLIIYNLERMGKPYDGINLNKLVREILNDLSIEQKDLFTQKLLNVGYTASNDYENFVYQDKGYKPYIVNADFPRLRRDVIPNSIGKVQYELIISQLSNCQTTLVY